MFLAADEIARSLGGSWDLLNRRAQGLSRFEFGEAPFWRSFGAPLLTAPAAIIWLAADRLETGQLSGLFDDPAVVARTAFHLAALWLTLPLLGIAFLKRDSWARLVPFIIVCNWSFVLAAALLTLPALLFAIGWATPALATLYSVASIVLIMQMRWFSTKVTLGLTSSAALMLAAGDGLVGIGILRAMV
ncbi:MAG: hypothetical protein JWL93_1755 [Hyphomicrobiales bacterium]|jgi:hypothetical protein|nr:hypothetical protein [Hyphomicrobiales bacterium]